MSTCCSSITKRSFTSTRCGEINKPVCLPAAWSIEARKEHTDPLPLVPATWRIFIRSWGSPRYRKIAFVFSRVFFFVNLGVSSI